MRNDLVETVERYAVTHGGDGAHETAIGGLGILRWTDGHPPTHLIHTPTLCVVVQGAKETTIGKTTHEYRAGEALVVTVDVPAVSMVTDASPEAPYLSVIFELDSGIVAEVLGGLDAPPEVGGAARPGLFVIGVGAPLADCMLRAVRLLDTPDAIPLLFPAIEREVAYRLLTGPHGAAVAALSVADERTPDVSRAVHVLRDRFAETIRVEELAEVARLSPSAFHRRFKAMTSMTPLQYQKRLRLIEARRLLVADAVTAEAAAHAVGYESASQFSREYARAFGAPPRRDVRALRESAESPPRGRPAAAGVTV